jgi:aminopeptidase N
VAVLTENDLRAGKGTLGKPGQTLTWRFKAQNVRDFAFAVGDHYLWDMTGARVTRDGPRSVATSAVYRPNAPGFRDVAEFARISLETFSTAYPGVPYPYPAMTVVEGGDGGMEYPMIVLDGAVPDRNRTLEVTAHEIGHTYFPMLVGSNETVYGWQDEGLNTFITFWPQEAMDYQPQAREEVATTVAFLAGQELEMPLMTPANSFFLDGPWYFLAAYAKPAAALLVLRDALTPPVFDQALHEYVRRWTNKHPSPWDFFNTIEDVAKQDLAWFWSGWFFGRGVLDQGITGVESSQGSVKVTVESRGVLYAPVEVEVENDRGEKAEGALPGGVWPCGARQVVEVPLDGKVTAVTLNPDSFFPDSDPSDNRWTPGSPGD